MDNPEFFNEMREKISITLQTYQTTQERACTILDSVHNNISTIVSNLSNIQRTVVNKRMLDQRVDSGETSFNAETGSDSDKTDSDSDKTDSDSDKTAESTSPSADYFHGQNTDCINSVHLDQNPHMLPTSEDFAEILNTRGVPIEDQSDTTSKSLLKADCMHFESGCSRTLNVDTTQGPRNTTDVAQSPSNPVDTAQGPSITVDSTQGPRNTMDMAQSLSNPVDTTQGPRNTTDVAQSSSNPVDTTQGPSITVDSTQGPRNTMDMAQSLSNPVDTTQGPRNTMDMAQSLSIPADTTQRPSKKWLPLGLGGVLLTFLLLHLSRETKPSSSS